MRDGWMDGCWSGAGANSVGCGFSPDLLGEMGPLRMEQAILVVVTLLYS